MAVTASAKSLDPRFIWEAPTTGSENVDEIWGATPVDVLPASAWGEPSFNDVTPANVWKKAS
jgi:hypothetical protein